MSVLIDFLLVGVVIAIVILSAKKGFVITLLEIVAFIAAIFLAGQCAAPVASFAYSTMFESSVNRRLYDAFPSSPTNMTNAQKAEKALTGMPDFAKNYALSVGINTDKIAEKFAESNIENNDNYYVSVSKQIVRPIAVAVLKSIMFFVLSIVFGIILRFVAKSINAFIRKSKILGPANAVLGGGFGILKGLVVVFLICCLLSYIQPRINNQTLYEGVGESAIVNAAAKYDPLEAISASMVFGETNS